MNRPSDEQLKALGASLREIDPATLVPDDEGNNVRWFQGENATELFAWERQGLAPHHVQLVFARVSAEWDHQQGLTTGTFASGSSTAGGRYDPYLLSVGQVADEDVCRAALLLLRSSKIDPAVANPMIQAIEAALAAKSRAQGPGG